MALIFIEGFDKQGPPTTSAVPASNFAGEWSLINTQHYIAAGLSSTGYAYQNGGNGSFLTKTLPNSYGRLIGGVRFSSANTNYTGLFFMDAGTAQCHIRLNSTGTISIYNGTTNGTVIATSTASFTANSVHYLEWDITFSATGAYQIWVDSSLILSGTGNTKTTANNTANGIWIGTGAGATNNSSWDDMYLLDTTGTSNNAVLLSSPHVETSFPISDSTVQFSFGAAIIGSTISYYIFNYNSSANNLYLRPLTSTQNCTINSIGMLPAATNVTVQLRPVLYADSSGVPGALLSAGATITGITNNTMLTMPLSTPQSLVAGTRYWLGVMNDIAVNNQIAGLDGTSSGRYAVVTFSSGAPATAPTMNAGQYTAVIFGNVTGTSNYYPVSQNPPQGPYSYVSDANVGDEDLYNFANLSSIPSTIHAVAIKANCARMDTGARTVSMRVKSGSIDSGGTLTGQAPGTSYGWLWSHFETDPNTSAAWTPANVNAAKGGFKIDS